MLENVVKHNFHIIDKAHKSVKTGLISRDGRAAGEPSPYSSRDIGFLKTLPQGHSYTRIMVEFFHLDVISFHFSHQPPLYISRHF